MKIGCRLATALFVWVVAASAPVPLFAQAIQRSLYVSVLDDRGAPIPDLGPADFIVREDNVAREVLTVAPASDPMLIALLVDTSQASADFIRDYRQALPAFIDAVTGDDAGAMNLVSLIGIGERPTILTDYTSNKADAHQRRAAPVRHSAGGHLPARWHHRSQPGHQEATAGTRGHRRPHLRGARVERSPLPDGARGACMARARRFTSSSSARQSIDRRIGRSSCHAARPKPGAATTTSSSSSGLDTKLKQVAAELTSQYRVTYARPQSLIPPERVKIETTRAKATARGIPVNEPNRPSRERR